MLNFFENSKNALIVLADVVNSDMAAAASAIAQNLANKKVIIFSKDAIGKQVSTGFGLDRFEQINVLPPKQYIFNINKKDGKVKSIKWSQTESAIQFFITPDSRNFVMKDVDFYSTVDFDLIITIGCQKLPFDPSELTSKNIIINIDNNPANSKFGKVNKILQGKSISGVVLNLLEEMEQNITRGILLTLFKGILWFNNGLHPTDEIINITKKLGLFDIPVLKSIDEMYSSLSLEQLNFIGTLIRNTKQHIGGIVSAHITNSNENLTNPADALYPELNILSRLAETNFVVIFADQGLNKNTVNIYSSRKEVNLLEVFSRYTPTGHPQEILFSMEGEFGDTEQTIIGQLQGIKLTDSK